MGAYLHEVQQQVSDRHRQCCVCSNGDFSYGIVFLFQIMVQQMSEKGKQLQLLQQQLLKYAEKEGEEVHLQGQLLEANTKMTQLDGECCNRTLLKAKNDRVVALQMS